jgi:hypothetical protein
MRIRSIEIFRKFKFAINVNDLKSTLHLHPTHSDNRYLYAACCNYTCLFIARSSSRKSAANSFMSGSEVGNYLRDMLRSMTQVKSLLAALDQRMGGMEERMGLLEDTLTSVGAEMRKALGESGRLQSEDLPDFPSLQDGIEPRSSNIADTPLSSTQFPLPSFLSSDADFVVPQRWHGNTDDSTDVIAPRAPKIRAMQGRREDVVQKFAAVSPVNRTLALQPPATSASPPEVVIKFVRPPSLVDEDIDKFLKEAIDNTPDFCKAFHAGNPSGNPQDFKDYAVNILRERFPQRYSALNQVMGEELVVSKDGKPTVERKMINREFVLSEKLRNIYKHYQRTGRKPDSESFGGKGTTVALTDVAARSAIVSAGNAGDGEEPAEEEALSAPKNTIWSSCPWLRSEDAERTMREIVEATPEELAKSGVAAIAKKQCPYAELLAAWGSFHSVLQLFPSRREWVQRARESLRTVSPVSLFPQGAKSVVACFLTCFQMTNLPFDDFRRRVLRVALLLLLRSLLANQGNTDLTVQALQTLFVSAPEILETLFTPSEIEKIIRAIVAIIRALSHTNSVNAQYRVVYRTLRSTGGNITLLASFHILIDVIAVDLQTERDSLDKEAATPGGPRDIRNARKERLGKLSSALSKLNSYKQSLSHVFPNGTLLIPAMVSLLKKMGVDVVKTRDDAIMILSCLASVGREWKRIDAFDTNFLDTHVANVGAVFNLLCACAFSPLLPHGDDEVLQVLKDVALLRDTVFCKHLPPHAERRIREMIEQW